MLAAWTALAGEPSVALTPPDQPLSAQSQNARQAWWVAEQEQGSAFDFVLYQRDVEDSSYSRYRMEAVMSEPLKRVVEALRIKSEDDKYLGEGQKRTLFRDRDGNKLEHLYIDAPFVSDRDVILRSSSGYRTDGAFRVDWWAANDDGPPTADGVVRMPRSEGFWHLTPLSGTRTLVVYEQFAELGGSVPGWLINARMDDEILSELFTLRDILRAQLPAVSTTGENALGAGID